MSKKSRVVVVIRGGNIEGIFSDTGEDNPDVLVVDYDNYETEHTDRVEGSIDILGSEYNPMEVDYFYAAYNKRNGL